MALLNYSTENHHMKQQCYGCHETFYAINLITYHGMSLCPTCLAAKQTKRSKHNPRLQMQAKNKRIGIFMRPTRSTCR